jgi:hypothetical protein
MDKKNNPNNLQVKFWRLLELENNTNCHNTSHILWPIENIKKNKEVEKYLALHDSPMLFRDLKKPNGYHCEKNIFSSETNRQILEEEFTLAGIKINNAMSDDLSKRKYWKPLGVSSFSGLGFGALVFSYRNCPNNTPLAFWWGDWNEGNIWYPLFQRKTYSGMEVEKIFGALDIKI